MDSGYSVISLGKMRMQPEWRYTALHSSDSAQLFWFTRGQGRFSIGAITRGYGPHTAVFLPPGAMMAVELSPQIQGLRLNMPADPDLGLPEKPFHIRVTGVAAQGALTGHIDMLERELAGNAPAQHQALKAYGLLISVWIARQLDIQDGSVLRDRSHVLAQRYAGLVEEHYASGVGVAGYANELGVTPTHLSRICRESAGRPAHAILKDRIMHEACRLLADTELPARRVAADLGFSSAAYFTRAFAGHIGQTPSQFRSRSSARSVLHSS